MSPANRLSFENVSELPDRVFFLEYIYCLLFFSFLVLGLAVASFDPSDPTLFNIAATTSTAAKEAGVTNVFGPLGATLADWFYQLFGLGSLIFSLVFIAQLLSTFRKPKTASRLALRAFGYPQLVVCYLGLLCAISPEISYKGVTFLSGGVIGFQVSSFFSQALGQNGARIALSFGVVASLPLCLGFRPVTLLHSLFSKIPWATTREFLLGLLDKENIREPQKVDTLSKKTNSKTNDSFTFLSLKDDNEASQAAKSISTKEAPMEGDSEPLIESTKVLLKAVENPTPQYGKMVGPSELKDMIKLLDYHTDLQTEKDPQEEQTRLRSESRILEEKMATFGVLGNVVRSQPGPVVNVHEFEPASGIKVTKVLSLQDDLALGLKAQSVIMAPQPGKSTIGIEVPSPVREVVSLRELMETNNFQNHRAPLPMVLGKLVDGSPLIADLTSMPHLLVAGATGSGKSVGVNTMLLSLMMARTPKQLRLILVDPKMLELSNYDGIGHLLMPVVTEPQRAAGALKWAIAEMERRYKMMKIAQVRNVISYNAMLDECGGQKEIDGLNHESLPYIVVVIDELCDLMMTAPKDVEDSVQRLAQKARAAGIHLILATQRPSVDVLTGVIKANLPCRLSFQVTSKHDSRTIIETIGAEKLLGKGDMLFLPPGTSKLVRAHGAFVGDKEINAVADKLRILYPSNYENRIISEVDAAASDMSQKNDEKSSSKYESINADALDENELYERAKELAFSTGKISTSSIQRAFHIGYNRAARLMDRMVKEKIVAENEVAGKPREVIGHNR